MLIYASASCWSFSDCISSSLALSSEYHSAARLHFYRSKRILYWMKLKPPKEIAHCIMNGSACCWHLSDVCGFDPNLFNYSCFIPHRADFNSIKCCWTLESFPSFSNARFNTASFTHWIITIASLLYVLGNFNSICGLIHFVQMIAVNFVVSSCFFFYY